MKIKNTLKQLKLNKFISIDIETTGLNPEFDKITEISAVLFEDGKEIDNFTTLINPVIGIPGHIEDLTGITNNMVKDQPMINDVASDFINFIGEYPIVGQNIQFDINFLNNEISSLLINYGNCYDTLYLAKALIWYVQEFNLGFLSNYYGFDIEGSHRAYKDAQNTGKLFISLIDEIPKYSKKVIEKFVYISDESMPNSNLFKNILECFDSNFGNNKYVDKVGLVSNVLYNNKSKLPINLDDTSNEILGNKGILSKSIDECEFRSQQLDMSENISKCISNGDIILAEGGTGLGKSFAYLVSGISESLKNKIPLVVATNTKALQNQLFEKDIPVISDLFNHKIKSVVIKGRNNYVCKNRVNNLLETQLDILLEKEKLELLALVSWVESTTTGDVSECFGFNRFNFGRLWDLLSSDAKYCTWQQCKDSCFYSNLILESRDADILVVNHAMLLYDIELESQGILPPKHIFVIDEAHNLISAAKSAYKKEFDELFFITPLYQIKKILNDQLNLDNSLLNDINRVADETISLIHNFFDSIEDIHFSDNRSNYSVVDFSFTDPFEYFLDCTPSIEKLIFSLKDCCEKLNNFLADDDFEVIDSIFLYEEKINMFSDIVKNHGSYVMWASFKKYTSSISLNFLFKELGENIYNNYFSKGNSGVICSSTLTVDNDFSYIINSLGLQNYSADFDLITKIFYSPFYYEDQCDLLVYKSDFDINSKDYLNDISSQILYISKNTNKRMLVLCTSYQQINFLKNNLCNEFQNEDKKIYFQTRGMNKNALIYGYRKNPGSILVATMALWEGVDFKGDELEMLMIIRVPFVNPNDPYTKHIIANYDSLGMNAFNDYQIPEACLKLKQGFGRLIRTSFDSGICLITDPRLLTKYYGSKILGSFPLDFKKYDNIRSISL